MFRGREGNDENILIYVETNHVHVTPLNVLLLLFLQIICKKYISTKLNFHWQICYFTFCKKYIGNITYMSFQNFEVFYLFFISISNLLEPLICMLALQFNNRLEAYLSNLFNEIRTNTVCIWLTHSTCNKYKFDIIRNVRAQRKSGSQYMY